MLFWGDSDVDSLGFDSTRLWVHRRNPTCSHTVAGYLCQRNTFTSVKPPYMYVWSNLKIIKKSLPASVSEISRRQLLLGGMCKGYLRHSQAVPRRIQKYERRDGAPEVVRTCCPQKWDSPCLRISPWAWGTVCCWGILGKSRRGCSLIHGFPCFLPTASRNLDQKSG